jgi:hypothetical protein
MPAFKGPVLVLLAALALTTPGWAQSDAAAPPPGAKPKPSAQGAAAAGSDKPASAKPSAEPAPTRPEGAAAGKEQTASGAAPTPKTSAESKPADAAGAPIDGATYVVRLRDLEQRIDELKEQIRRSHTRLSLLSDTILSGGVGGARAEIKFVNDMSSAFRLTRALVVLDGAVQYNKQDDSGALAEQKEIPIFSGSITPGDHTLQVLVKLRGHGYGVFSYLRGYQFEVKSDHSFTVTEGKTIELKVVAYEKGGVTTPLEQRPAVRYEQKLKSGVTGGGSPTPGAARRTKGSGSVSVGTGGE